MVLNLPLIAIWVMILKIPYKILFPLILLFCLIGSYSLNNSVKDMWMTIFFGIIGYWMRKTSYPSAPLVMALVLGPMFEVALRQSLIMSSGNLSIFNTIPLWERL